MSRGKRFESARRLSNKCLKAEWSSLAVRQPYCNPSSGGFLDFVHGIPAVTLGLPFTGGRRAASLAVTWAPEDPRGAARIFVAAPVPDLCHRQVGLDERASRLREAALGYPLLHRASRLAPYDGGKVARGEADNLGHVLEMDGRGIRVRVRVERRGGGGLRGFRPIHRQAGRSRLACRVGAGQSLPDVA